MSESVPQLSSRTWLVTGASGLLGHALCSFVAERGERVVGVRLGHPVDVEGVSEVVADLTDRSAVAELMAMHRPDVVVHAAGLTDVDACERAPDLAHRLHVEATGTLATIAAHAGAAFLHISTDHLWDGGKPMVSESEPPCPLNAYARTKLQGEEAALAGHPSALVLRTNFFGEGRPWRRSFSDWVLTGLSEGKNLRMFTDVFFTPIALGHLCPLLVEMADLKAQGIYHLAGGERLSKYEFGRLMARTFGFSESLIEPGNIANANLAAPRPRDMSLDCGKAAALLGRPLPGASAGIALLRSDQPRFQTFR